MSAGKKKQRAKRAHKASDTGVQSVSPWSSDNDMPSQLESMPQPDGSGVAEGDR